MPVKLTQSYAILQFYKNLQPAFKTPGKVHVMNPFTDPGAWVLVEKFYRKYYDDAKRRIFIFGINPGRFGGGVTGIPFTDPIRLAENCGITNDLAKRPELSSEFIYQMIDTYGGPSVFYAKYFITALSPLGFTLDEKNLNYYDDKSLLQATTPFIVDCIHTQLDNIRATRDICYCLGEGTNYKIFSRLNDEHGFFKKIVPLPHPRWIMQYRRKRVGEFVELYVEKLREFE